MFVCSFGYYTDGVTLCVDVLGFAGGNLHTRQRPEDDLPQFQSFGVQTRPQGLNDTVVRALQSDEGETASRVVFKTTSRRKENKNSING